MRVLLTALFVALPSLAAPVLVDRVVASVDGQLVFQSQVEWRVSQQKGLTKETRPAALLAARAELIDGLLIAKDLGFAPTDAEVDTALDAVAKENGLDRAGLEAAVKKQGLRVTDYREQVRTQLLEMRWLIAKANGAALESEKDRTALRARLLSELRKRAVIEVFE